MRTLIFRTAATYLTAVMLLFSVFVLLRGHNDPGGGFIGGLVFASAVVLRVMVDPRHVPKWDPIGLAGGGLLLALASAVSPLLVGLPFFTGLWFGEIWLPAIGKLKLGTPLIFDTGVFLVVTGVGAKMLLVLLEKRELTEKQQRRS